MKRKLYTFLMSLMLIGCMFLSTACNSSSQGKESTESTQSEESTDSAQGEESTDSTESTQKEESTVPVKRDTKLLSGSFLQSWICRDWTYTRWEQELTAMKELGMDFIIIQSVTDQSYRLGSAEKQDWASYTFKGQTSLYPSEIEELKDAIVSSQNNGDALELLLKAAKEKDMKVYIGLLSDDRWWDFGWGTPKLPEGKTDPATESYFATWCEYNGKLNGQMITEIWERYGEEYGEQIAGWYYYNEIWNIDVACLGADDKAYATCIGDNINHMLDAINGACPEKPLMLSPYFNISISTAKQYRNFWIDIFRVANFRAGDIFAPQDCVGAKNLSIKNMEKWISALKEAADTEEGMRFWVNNESFTSDFQPADISRFIEQIETSEKYAETHITFSWNHYYNPVNKASAESYNNELIEYLKYRLEIE